jgi:hypothetical protein
VALKIETNYWWLELSNHLVFKSLPVFVLYDDNSYRMLVPEVVRNNDNPNRPCTWILPWQGSFFRNGAMDQKRILLYR